VGTKPHSQAALLLLSERWRVVRFRGVVGWLERRERELDQDVLNSHHDAKCGDPILHDRMPVILDPASHDLWLDPGMQNIAAISELAEADAYISALSAAVTLAYATGQLGSAPR